jgi:hypothetical protein
LYAARNLTAAPDFVKGLWKSWAMVEMLASKPKPLLINAQLQRPWTGVLFWMPLVGWQLSGLSAPTNQLAAGVHLRYGLLQVHELMR